MAEKNTPNGKLTPFQKEQIESAKKIVEYKLAAEANVVACIYKNPEEIFNLNLEDKDFSNNIWRVYFIIAHDILLVEKKGVLDDLTIGFYLEKHPKLKEKYDEYGGYKTILNSTEYVNIANLNGYVTEIRKWNALIKLTQQGFPIKDNLPDYIDMTAEEIYQQFETRLNHTFVNVDSDVKSYDFGDNIFGLIDDLDKGMAIGLPYYDMPMITAETGGQYLGSITLVGGLSNVGKTTFARNAVIPSIIENNEKLVVMLNEDGLKKWQREMLVWVCNNVLHYDIQKHTVRDGKFSPEVKQKLIEAGNWILEKTNNHTITVVPFEKYKTSTAIKTIRKYAAMGVKYFLLDTFKADAGCRSENTWLQMQQSMVEINDVIKPESLNLHILITCQLEKSSAKQRYYTQNNIGMARNIVDPVSTCVMIRDLWDDERTDGKHEIKVYRPEGKDGKTKVQVKLQENIHYQILFIVKNREGAANVRQIVLEHDMSRNLVKEIGCCNIAMDF